MEPTVLLVIGILLGIGGSVVIGNFSNLFLQENLKSKRSRVSLKQTIQSNRVDGLECHWDERSLTAVRDQKFREAAFDEAADAIFLVDAETLLTLDCNAKAVELYEADNKQQLINIEGHRLQRYPLTEEELQQSATEMNRLGEWSRELE